MIETTDSNIHPVDSLIERTLARDAERTRKRFAAVPNAQLTAKLALTTASRGLLSGLGAKLALYAGGALLIGSAAYFIPSMNRQPLRTIAPIPSPMRAASPSVQHSSALATLPTPPEIGAKATTPAAMVSSHLSSRALPLKLDEGDSKNIPRITDPRYGGPLK